MVKKIGNAYCVVHGHPKKKGSKTDKPIGTVIKCFNFNPKVKGSEARAKAKAMAMHRAIMAKQKKKK